MEEKNKLRADAATWWGGRRGTPSRSHRGGTAPGAGRRPAAARHRRGRQSRPHGRRRRLADGGGHLCTCAQPHPGRRTDRRAAPIAPPSSPPSHQRAKE